MVDPREPKDRFSALRTGGLLLAIPTLLIVSPVVGITGHERGTRAALKQAIVAALGMLALFGAGGMLLTALPAAWMLAGFLVPYAVLVLKAASLVLLESSAWRWIVADPWRASI